MTIYNHRACGFCIEFAAKAGPASACRQGNPGNAGSTVHATQRPCVLFVRVREIGPREKLVSKHQQREPA